MTKRQLKEQIDRLENRLGKECQIDWFGQKLGEPTGVFKRIRALEEYLNIEYFSENKEGYRKKK